MRGVVFDVKRGSVKDGPGIRTSVFFKGCPLRCIWCHNPESWLPEPEPDGDGVIGRETSVEALMEEILVDRIFYRASGGGVTLTGGEPMMQFPFLRELLRAAKAAQISTALDTCGFAPWEEYREILELVDLFLYDFKASDPVRHRELTGVENRLILENLRRLNEAGAAIFLRCPLVPDVNDSPDHLAAIAALAEELSGIEEVTLEPYHPLGVEKAERLGRCGTLKCRNFPPPESVNAWRKTVASRTRKRVVVS